MELFWFGLVVVGTPAPGSALSSAGGCRQAVEHPGRLRLEPAPSLMLVVVGNKIVAESSICRIVGVDYLGQTGLVLVVDEVAAIGNPLSLRHL